MGMNRRALVIALLLACVASAAFVGWGVLSGRRAAAMVVEAEALLTTPLSQAPTVDRLHASAALSLLERAATATNDDRRVRGLESWARSLTHLQRGDLVFALDELTEARHRLGWTADLHVVAGEIARRKTDALEAEEHAQAALALDGDHPRALLLSADLALDAGDAATARAHLARLLRTCPDVAAVHNRMALALEATGDEPGAETEVLEAIRLDRRDADPHINLGRLLARRGDHGEARRAFDQAVTLRPTDPDAFLGRGLASAALADAPAAEADLRRAARLAPNDAEPLLALGDLARDLGRIDGAIALYRQALDREDADAAAWLKLGNALVIAGDPGSAVAAFDEAVRRAPRLGAAHNGRGAALMQLARDDEAALALELAADLDDADPNPLLNLALLSDRRGDGAEAEDLRRQAAVRGAPPG